MQFDFSEQFSSILKQITGLNPSAWLGVDRGFVREEYKSLCFAQGLTVSAEGLVNPKQFAQARIPESQGRLLEATARVELLRLIFKKPEVKSLLPILSSHRFRPRFYEGLDFSLQQGRLFFAHLEESKVIEARLTERLGINPKRDEFFILNQLWERTLELKNLWDEPKLYEDAANVFSETEITEDKKMFLLSHFPDPPRIQYFWNEVSRKIALERISSQNLRVKQSEKYPLQRKQGHSLEDAVQFLFDVILSDGKLENHAIVIQDEPEIRRTLKRVMEQRGLELNDPRDPTLLVQSEGLKLALLELEMVSKNFSSGLVLAWMKYQSLFTFEEEGEFRKKIIENGIQSSIDAYSFLPKLFVKLQEVEKNYPSRIHLNSLETAILNTARNYQVASWVTKALEKVFLEWKNSLLQLELEERVRPLRYWLELLTEKLKRANPQSSPLKYRGGIQLFRVDQAPSPLLDPTQTQIHFLGVGTSFFEPREEGNDWFSTREQEVLSQEFGLISYQEIQKNRSQSFLSWVSLSKRNPAGAVFWECLYDEEGGETESTELQLTLLPEIQVSVPEVLSVHPTLQKSMQTELRVHAPGVSVKLDKKDWPISFLNAYGTCPFLAFSAYCLSLYDERETDFELKGDSFGNIVHAALEILIKEKTTPEAAFEHAWQKKKPIAWLKSDRLFKGVRNKTLTLLREFERSEEEYRSRSGAEVLALEMEVVWEKEGFVFKGRADRVDQHADGLVLMDYKTSASLPTGKETMEKGLGLQLPAYALALKEKLNQEVVTAQYLHLTPHKVNRNIGLLFKGWNQSKISDSTENAVTTARSTSQSILLEHPEVVWAKLDAKVKLLLDRLKQGDFSANPADPTECKTCRYSLVCGKKRGGSEVEVRQLAAPRTRDTIFEDRGRMLHSLRSKVFAFLSLLILVSLSGVTISFWITQRVNSRLSEINGRSVPMQRELTQLSSDTELLKRELDRSLGFSHWSDARWKPKRIPVWAIEVHRATLERLKPEDLNTRPWQDWYSRLLRMNSSLGDLAEQLFVQLQAQNFDKASELYPEWLKDLDMIQKEVDWAKREIDSETRTAFKDAQNQVQDLRLALQLLLLVVIGIALIMVWMGERALRPIGRLRKIVQAITERGALTSQEKASLPDIPLSKTDEVSELAREFHQMATSLIEREKMIDFQKERLEEQNKLLMQMGELQKRLQQAEHLAAVGRMSAQVAHEVGNPLHSIGLEAELALDVASKLTAVQSTSLISLKQSLQSILQSVERLQKIIQNYLRLSKPTHGSPKPISLQETLENVLATYANSLQSMKVKIDWNFNAEWTRAGAVLGDPDLLEYAIGNLMKNSIQALEAKPENDRRILIEVTRKSAHQVKIIFGDSGPGISADVQKNLFKPFITTKAQGTGLGLSFVKKVFNDLGGDLVLLYSAKNQGTQFEGTLPLHATQTKVSPPPRSPNPSIGASP